MVILKNKWEWSVERKFSLHKECQIIHRVGIIESYFGHYQCYNWFRRGSSMDAKANGESLLDTKVFSPYVSPPRLLRKCRGIKETAKKKSDGYRLNKVVKLVITKMRYLYLLVVTQTTYLVFMPWKFTVNPKNHEEEKSDKSRKWYIQQNNWLELIKISFMKDGPKKLRELFWSEGDWRDMIDSCVWALLGWEGKRIYKGYHCEGNLNLNCILNVIISRLCLLDMTVALWS